MILTRSTAQVQYRGKEVRIFPCWLGCKGDWKYLISVPWHAFETKPLTSSGRDDPHAH